MFPRLEPVKETFGGGSLLVLRKASKPSRRDVIWASAGAGAKQLSWGGRAEPGRAGSGRARSTAAGAQQLAGAFSSASPVHLDQRAEAPRLTIKSDFQSLLDSSANAEIDTIPHFCALRLQVRYRVLSMACRRLQPAVTMAKKLSCSRIFKYRSVYTQYISCLIHQAYWVNWMNLSISNIPDIKMCNMSDTSPDIWKISDVSTAGILRG